MTFKVTLTFGIALLMNLAQGAVIYNETVSGDLSNSGLAPNVVTVGLGSNQIFGTTGSSAGTVDRDYFTFSVAPGLQLSAITILPGTTTGGALSTSFIGVQAGTQVTLATNASSAAGLLGWWHYGPADVNSNILPEMAIPANGSSGFSVPLGSGNYAFWVQELSASSFNYGFDFTITPAAIPEPASYITMFSALGVLGLVLRRSRRWQQGRPSPFVVCRVVALARQTT